MSYEANPALIFSSYMPCGRKLWIIPKHCKHDIAKHVYILCGFQENANLHIFSQLFFCKSVTVSFHNREIYLA